MRAEDYVVTPRFGRVKIEQIFESVEELRAAGYTEPTYLRNCEYEVLGRSIDMYHMEFAAGHRSTFK